MVVVGRLFPRLEKCLTLLPFFTPIFLAAASFLKLNHFSPIPQGHFPLKTSELWGNTFQELCCSPMTKLSIIKKTSMCKALGHAFMFLQGTGNQCNRSGLGPHTGSMWHSGIVVTGATASFLTTLPWDLG